MTIHLNILQPLYGWNTTDTTKTLSNQSINKQFAPPLSKIALYLVWLKEPVHIVPRKQI